ncbi:MAG: cytochrome c oxidase subunit I [Acidimicrobiia bacterium]|nr:cytochrome c oxidase subunit I [Acidimicrobiia bacterium]
MTTVDVAVPTRRRVPVLLRRPRATTGVWSWFTTVDHKKIGIMYGAGALIFFVVGGIEALLIRLQLAGPDGSLLTAGQYNQLFTMHGTTMVFLLGMPLAAAFGNYLIPLMIGARDVAFPRLNIFGFWVFVMGGVFLYSSFLPGFGGAPDGGWFGYTPLTSTPLSSGFLPGHGPDFWAVGLILLGIGSTLTAINLIVTILNMRAPGMTLMRMPVFVWMMLVTAFLILFAMPPVTAALLMVIFDRSFGTLFFDATAGGDPLLYQHLFWIFGHPEVYILILPGMGIVSEILPVFSRKPLFGYSVVVFSGIAIGFMGWGVWAHHMFASGLGPVAVSAFGLSTMFIAVPTGVKIFNWLGTLWGGSIRLTAPLLYMLGFIAQFTIGGLSGVMHSIVPADTQQTDTYFVVAHFHYVLFGGLVFAVLGGITYWFPKLYGRFMDERLGKIAFWTLVVGFNLTFFPMHFVGLMGMPRRTYVYGEGLGWDFMNLLATIGSFVIAAAVLVFVVNLLVSRSRGKPAGDDPWDARTLEWTTSSPPPEYNFAEIPTVHSRDDYWHRKYTEDEEGRLVRLPRGGADDEGRSEAGTAVATAEGGEVATGHGGGDGHGIHMPSPSYFPLVMAIGLPVIGYAVVYKSIWLALAGAVVLLYGMYAWAIEPPTDPAAE